MKAFKILILLVLGVVSGSVTAQTKYYLGYDANCMDRYEYHYTSNPTGNAHIAYHIIMNDREKVKLEVGIESRINQARPDDVKSCANFSINERMVRKINNGEVQLFIVKKSGNGYNVSEVGLAAYSQISPASVSFSAMDGRFSYNYAQPADGTNLATANSSSSVFFEGLVSHDCPKKYQFNKRLTGGGENFVSQVLIPEIGVIQEKKGFNATDAENKVLNLTSINGTSLGNYLATYCRNVDTDFYSGKFYHMNTADYTTSGDNSWEVAGANVGKTTTHNNTSQPTTTTGPTYSGNCSVYKDVDRGIYMDFATGQPANTTCGGNTYNNGFRVGESTTVVSNNNTSPTTNYPPPPAVVRPPTTYIPPTPAAPRNTSLCSETSTYGIHVVQRNETLYSISRLYNITVNELKGWNKISQSNRIYPCTKLKTVNPATPVPSNNVVMRDKGELSYAPNLTGVHTVAKNETLYQIANRYGYTVDKLRNINGLGKSDRIYIGQQIKIQECNCPDMQAKGAADDETAYASAIDTRVVPYNNVPREYSYLGEDRLVAKGTEASVAYAKGQKRRFHVVKEDDTVFYISKKYGITVEQLRKLNDLSEKEVIVPYQRIYLD